MTPLQEAVLAIVGRPMCYQEIAQAIKVPHSDLDLGRALTQLVLDKKLNLRSPGTYQAHYPVYYKGRLPKGFKFPKRGGAVAAHDRP